MAVPAYTTDLTDIYTDTSNFSTVGGGRVTGSETDDFIQGNNCWSHDPFSSGTEGGMHNSAQTITADDAVLLHLKCDVVATLATKANGGMQALIGSAVGDYKCWYIRGSDDYAAGGWINIAIDPLVTQSETVGTPTTTTSWFGCRWYVPSSGASKGYPMKVDAIRQGRAELLINGGQAGSLATFAGAAAINDLQANKWGLLEAQEGGAAGYRWKGLMSFGPTSLTTFTDSDVAIFIENTEYVSSSFNRMEFNNASSVINWTNISITALGTVAKGELAIIDDCVFNDNGGVFTDMSTFVYDSNYTGTGRTWRRCGLVTQGGGTFTICTFDASTATVALSVDDISLVTLNKFNSDGTGHAVDIGNFAATASIDWDNFESGYVSGTTGSPVTTGTSGNETILCDVDSGQVLTINVAEGASTPSVKNDGTGTVNVVAGAITLKFIVKDQSNTEISGANAYIDDSANTAPFILNTATDVNGEASVSHSDGSVTGSVWRVRKYGYKPFIQIVDIGSLDITLPVTMITDPQQT